MSAREVLVAELIRDEGLRLLPYMDTVGKITIGVGRNLSDKGLQYAEAMTLLDHDLDEAITDLAGSFSWYGTLDEVRQRAITNMRFNLGPSRFRGFKRMLRAMAEQNYPMAATSAQQSVWFSQVGARAQRIVNMIRTGTV